MPLRSKPLMRNVKKMPHQVILMGLRNVMGGDGAVDSILE